MVTINELCALACSFENKKVNIKHIKGPEGVRGRNSENTLIKKVLGWYPKITLKDGLHRTYNWIKSQIQIERQKGNNMDFITSKVVKQDTDVLDNLSIPGLD